jgi:hypothetical protein
MLAAVFLARITRSNTAREARALVSEDNMGAGSQRIAARLRPTVGF